MAKGPVRLVLTMTVRSEDAVLFEAAWARAADWTGKRPGCLRQTLVLSPSRPSGTARPREVTYQLISDWADAKRFHAFERSREGADATAGLRMLRTSVRTEVWQIRDHQEAGP
ncbi:MAG TPA: antibiotic biosynthesis monooxygenase [Thermomonospora sp.]|nr:antibiotic biosynthesis monooxygenase [Thermomonospora sp.]